MCCSCSQQHDVVVGDPGNPRRARSACAGARRRGRRRGRALVRTREHRASGTNPATAARRCVTARSAPSPSRRRTTRWRPRRTTSAARTRPVRFPHSCATGSEGCSSTCTRAPRKGAASTPTSAGPTASSAPTSPRLSPPPGSPHTAGSAHRLRAPRPRCTCATASASWGRSGSAPWRARSSRFLDEHPREVLVIVFEDHLSTDRIADALRTSGLAPMLLPVEVGQPLPTLGAMIASGQRVFATLENGDGGPTLRNAFAGLVEETPFTFVHAARAPSRGLVRREPGRRPRAGVPVQSLVDASASLHRERRELEVVSRRAGGASARSLAAAARRWSRWTSPSGARCCRSSTS